MLICESLIVVDRLDKMSSRNSSFYRKQRWKTFSGMLAAWQIVSGCVGVGSFADSLSRISGMLLPLIAQIFADLKWVINRNYCYLFTTNARMIFWFNDLFERMSRRVGINILWSKRIYGTLIFRMQRMIAGFISFLQLKFFGFF